MTNQHSRYDRREVLALSGVAIAVGAAGCIGSGDPENDAENESEEGADGGGSEEFNNVDEEDLVRIAEAGGVSFEVMYVDPLLEDDTERRERYGESEDSLLFEVSMDAHAGDLTDYDWSERGRLLTDSGVVDRPDWVWESKSDHHPEGQYHVDKTVENDVIFTDETETIELRLRSVNDEEVRFGWDVTEYAREVKLSSLARAYVANASDGTVSVVDHASASSVETVDVADGVSHGIAATPDGDTVFVGDGDTGDLYPISTDGFEVGEPIEIDGDVHGVDIHPDGRYVYVSEGGLGDEAGVTVVDSETRDVVERLETGGAGHVNFGPEGRYVYLSNVGEDRIAVLDADAIDVVEDVRVGGIPNEAVASPDGNYVYTANVADDSVSVVETGTWDVVKTIEAVSDGSDGIDEGAHGIDVTPSGERLFVASRGAGVVVIDAADRQITDAVDVGGSANHVAIGPDGDYAYVSSMRDDEVVVINARSLDVVWRTAVGAEPHEIAFERI